MDTHQQPQWLWPLPGPCQNMRSHRDTAASRPLSKVVHMATTQHLQRLYIAMAIAETSRPCSAKERAATRLCMATPMQMSNDVQPYIWLCQLPSHCQRMSVYGRMCSRTWLPTDRSKRVQPHCAMLLPHLKRICSHIAVASSRHVPTDAWLLMTQTMHNTTLTHTCNSSNCRGI